MGIFVAYKRRYRSTELPVGDCVELLEVDALAIADVTEICEASVDEAKLAHSLVAKEFIVEIAGLFLIV